MAVLDWEAAAAQPEAPVDWESAAQLPQGAAPKKRSLLSYLGVPGEYVSSNLDLLSRGVFGVHNRPGELLAPSGGAPSIGEVARRAVDPSRGTPGQRLKEAAASVPDVLLQAAVPPIGGMRQQSEKLRSEGRAAEAEIDERIGQTLGDLAERVVVDPVNAVPFARIAGIFGKGGQIALRGLSAGMAAQAGMDAYEGIKRAHELYKKAGKVTPDVAQALTESAAALGMGGLAAYGAAGRQHGSYRDKQARAMLEEMRASAVDERLAAVDSGRAPDPAVTRTLETISSGDVLPKTEKLDIRRGKKELVLRPEGEIAPPPSAASFAKPSLSSGEVVRVDVDLLDQQWRKGSPETYVAAADAPAIEQMRAALDSGKPIEMPEVAWSDGKGLSVSDGIKRLSALRDAGVKEVEVLATPEDAAILRRHMAYDQSGPPRPDKLDLPESSPDAPLNMTSSDYVAALPETVTPKTPFKPVMDLGPTPSKQSKLLHRLTWGTLDALGEIHPKLKEQLAGMLRDKEAWQSKLKADVYAASKKMTRAEAAQIIKAIDDVPRESLSGAAKDVAAVLDRTRGLLESVPEVVAGMQKRGVGWRDNYAPHQLETPLTPGEKIELFAGELMRQEPNLTWDMAVRKANGQSAAAIRWADNEMHLSGSLTHSRTGTDRPLRQDLGAIYSYVHKAAEHAAEMKWLGEGRSKLTNAEGTGLLDALPPEHRAAAERLTDVIVGKDYGYFGRVMSKATYYALFPKMVKSALIQPSTLFNTVTVAGWRRSLASALKYLYALPSKDRRAQMTESAMRSEATYPYDSGEFGTQYGAGGRFMWGVAAADRAVRIMANDTAKRLLDDARAGDYSALNGLRGAGYFDQALARGKARIDSLAPTQENYELAGKILTDYTQLRTDAAHTPYWMDHPAGRAFMTLSRFPLQQGRLAVSVARNAVRNNDYSAVARLIPALLAAGVGINTVRGVMSNYGVQLFGDAETDANTIQDWKRDPKSFLKAVMSSRAAKIDPNHPETVVASMLQALVASGSMGIYENIIDRLGEGEPVALMGPIVEDAYNATKGTLDVLHGKFEAGAKNVLKVGGPIGSEISREFLSEDLPENAGPLGLIAEALQPSRKTRREQDKTKRDAEKARRHYEAELQYSLQQAGLAPEPKKMTDEEKTYAARLATAEAKAKADILEWFKRSPEQAKLEAAEADREFSRVLKKRHVTFSRWARELAVLQSFTPEEADRLLADLKKEQGGE